VTTTPTVRPTWRATLRALRDAGVLTPAWQPAFEAIDRAPFLPRLIWPYDMESRTSVGVDREADPDAWFRHVDADEPITTQWDDGAHEGAEPGRVATSSASMPSVVARMLRDAEVRPGQRVLEIGTGTGWNAALLTWRAGVGAGRVTSVEVDPAVASAAREALRAAGVSEAGVTVVTGDGERGCAERGPYDRVIATCGVLQVPGTWARQTVPGGLIVAPWNSGFTHRDAVVRLRVGRDGSARGPFTAPVEFMKLRAQRPAPPPHAAYLPDGFPGDATESTTRLCREDFDDPFSAFAFAAGLLVPECRLATDARGAERSVWLYGLGGDRSWAAAVLRAGRAETSPVHQSGPRRLWDELETAHAWWVARGRPAVGRFGLTVDPYGRHTAWLDAPERTV
jgi:protein-L-isoaspartate O-methyltransferase